MGKIADWIEDASKVSRYHPGGGVTYQNPGKAFLLYLIMFLIMLFISGCLG